ncbi:MAG TPA: hypothetical protein V6C97_13115 [Oculatellaceae cyanobacterium]
MMLTTPKTVVVETKVVRVLSLRREEDMLVLVGKKGMRAERRVEMSVPLVMAMLMMLKMATNKTEEGKLAPVVMMAMMESGGVAGVIVAGEEDRGES